MMPVPFFIIGDFEALLLPKKRRLTKSTRQVQEHKPCGFSYLVRSTIPEYDTNEIVIYRGPNAARVFCDKIQLEVAKIMELVRNPCELSMTDDDRKLFENARVCYACQKSFSDSSPKVADHCHISGHYRQALHQHCNLQWKLDPERYKVPVVFHNLQGYDQHIIVQGIKANQKVTCIARTFEKYITLQIGKHIKFVDSFNFLGTSLSTLIESLKDGPPSPEKFPSTVRIFGPENLSILCNKLSYPYSYMSSWKRFTETSLPSITCFFNDLTKTALNPADYERTRQVWDRFKLTTLGDLHDLYVAVDVCQLSDVIDNLRAVSLKTDRLDPLNYLTLAQMSWDAALLQTKMKLELLTSMREVGFLERGIRGGVVNVTKKHVKFNNPHTNPNAEPPFNYGLFLDATNLYGSALAARLPTGGFCFLSEDEVENFDVRKMLRDPSTGYILDVDLDYPKALHDEHDDYPLAPEKIAIPTAALSTRQRSIVRGRNERRPKNGLKKLCATLTNKRRYVVHGENLQFYLEMGMKLQKIHNILSFTQSAWLAPYVQHMTNLRKASRSKFEQDFYKLKINSVTRHGKSNY
jgi:hypothetical protein